MPSPVKHGLVGVCLLAAALIIVPALMNFAFYGLALIGVLAIARMLVRKDSSPHEPVVGVEKSTPANGPTIPDTPGRPR